MFDKPTLKLCKIYKIDAYEIAVGLFSTSKDIELSLFDKDYIADENETKKSINFNLLSKMPKGAVLVNTARKEVINEEELLKMFAERPDFKYLSDIEPECKAEIAEKYAGRYFFTPKKMGAQTEEANINAGIAAANQIADFFTTGNKKFQLNK